MYSSLSSLQRDFYIKYLSTIICIVGGYFALYLMDVTPGYGHHTTCPFKLATGIPCPGCGMGRATLALAHGDIMSSLHCNLLCIPFTIAIWTVVVWMIADLLRQRETIYPLLTRRAGAPLTAFLVIIISLNWVLNILHNI